jgi:hypothetical protein
MDPFFNSNEDSARVVWRYITLDKKLDGLPSFLVKAKEWMDVDWLGVSSYSWPKLSFEYRYGYLSSVVNRKYKLPEQGP